MRTFALLALASLLLLPLAATPAAADAVPEPDLKEPPCEAWWIGWYNTVSCTVGDTTFGCSWKTYQDAWVGCLLPTPCPTDSGATVDVGTAFAGTDGCVVVAGTRTTSAGPCQVWMDGTDGDPTTATCSWGSVYGYNGVSCTVRGSQDPVVATCTPDAPCFVADFWTEGFPYAGVWNNDCTYGAWAGTGQGSPCESTLSDPGTTTCTVGPFAVHCTTGSLYGASCSNDALSCSGLVRPRETPVARAFADTCRAGVVLDEEGIRELVQSLLPATQPIEPVDCTTTVMQHGCTAHALGQSLGVLCGPGDLGYGCSLTGDVECTQAEWGVKGSWYWVGGAHGCHAMVWVDDDRIGLV